MTCPTVVKHSTVLVTSKTLSQQLILIFPRHKTLAFHSVLPSSIQSYLSQQSQGIDFLNADEATFTIPHTTRYQTQWTLLSVSICVHPELALKIYDVCVTVKLLLIIPCYYRKQLQNHAYNRRDSGTHICSSRHQKHYYCIKRPTWP